MAEENTQLALRESQIDFQALQTTIDDGKIADYEVVDAYGAYATGNNKSTAINTIYNFAKAHPELGILLRQKATDFVQNKVANKQQIGATNETEQIHSLPESTGGNAGVPVLESQDDNNGTAPVPVGHENMVQSPSVQVPETARVDEESIRPIEPVEPKPFRQFENDNVESDVDVPVLEEETIHDIPVSDYQRAVNTVGDVNLIDEAIRMYHPHNYDELVAACGNISNSKEASRNAIKDIKNNKRSVAIDKAGGLQSYVRQLLYTRYGTTCLSAATLDFELNNRLSVEIKSAYPDGLLYWAIENIPEEKLPESPDAFLYNLKPKENLIDSIMKRCYKNWEENEYVIQVLESMVARAQSQGIYQEVTMEEAFTNFADNYGNSVACKRCDYNAPFNYLVWCGLKGLQTFQMSEEENDLVLNVLNNNPELLQKYADTYAQQMEQGVPEQVGAYIATQNMMEEGAKAGFFATAGQCIGKVVQAPFTAADNFSEAMAAASPHYAQSLEERRMLKEERRAHRQLERLNAEDMRHEQALYGQQPTYAQGYDPRMQAGTMPPPKPGFFERMRMQKMQQQIYNQPAYNGMYGQPGYNPYGQPGYGNQGMFEPYGLNMQPMSTKIIIILVHIIIAIIFFVINKKKGVFMIIGAILAIIGWINNNGSMRNRPPQYNMQGQPYPDGETGTINPIAFMVCGYIIMAIALFIH